MYVSCIQSYYHVHSSLDYKHAYQLVNDYFVYHSYSTVQCVEPHDQSIWSYHYIHMKLCHIYTANLTRFHSNLDRAKHWQSKCMSCVTIGKNHEYIIIDALLQGR